MTQPHHTLELDSTAQLKNSSTTPAVLDIAIYAALGSFLLGLISLNFVDIDLWHEMALIRESLKAGHLLTVDVFAYSPTLVPSVHHEWGAGVLAYLVSKWAGGYGIIALKLAAALVTLSICISTARRAGASMRTIAVLAPFGIYLMHAGFLSTVRAQAYTFVFLAILLFVLEQDASGSRRWIIPWLIVFPLWLNLHGGFVVGIAVVAMHAAGQLLYRRPWRHLAVVAVVMCAEVLVNPYGFAYVRYLSRALTMSRPHISEWDSIWGLGPLWSGFFVLAVAIAIASFARRRQRNPAVAIVLVATAIEGMLHRKLLPLFAIAWLSYVPAYVQTTAPAKWFAGFTERRRGFVFVCCTAVVAVSLISAIRMQIWQVRVPQGPPQVSYPVGAVDYLRDQRFHGNVMTPYAFGAYVSWKLYPAAKVSLDGRYEVAYPDSVVSDINAFYDGKADPRYSLTKYPPDVVLVPTEAAVYPEMKALAWQQVYSDKQYAVFARPGLALEIVDREGESFSGQFP